MASITLPPNSRAIGNTAHTADHNLLVDAITAVNAESTAMAAGVVSINAQTDSYTLVLADSGKLIMMAKATAQTLTVPLNSTAAFTIGCRIDIIQSGAGALNVAATGGVTIVGAGLNFVQQWAGASLIKTASDTWVLYGQVKA